MNSNFYLKKFEKNMKRIETRISSSNILELIQIQWFMDDLFEKLTFTHKIKTSNLWLQFKQLLMFYLKTFSDKKKLFIEESLNNELW